MKFRGETAGVEDKQVECIITNVFFCRFVIDLHSFDLVLITLEADVFF